MMRLRRAVSDGGGWLAAAALLAAFLVAAFVFNPIEEAEDHVAAPVAESLGITQGRCPDGWKDTSEEDEHTIVKSCQRGRWIVILDERNRFQHGFQVDTPGAEFVFDSRLVPGWPQ